jgi:predicted helicase
LYCEKILEHDQVWLFNDVPDDIRQKFNLTKKDYGIDIISKKGDDYFAIQCKYKKPKDKTQLISWRSLSTFYAYVAKVNGFTKHIVMTNVNGCKHIGDKTPKDLTIAYGTFKNINHFDWIKMSDYKEPIPIVPEPEVDSIEYIRLKRLQYFTLVDK